MATMDIACAAVGNYDQWALAAGADKVVAVAAPDDDATTRITEDTVNHRQSYTLTAATVATLKSVADSVTSVAVTSRGNKSGATTETYKHFLRLGGTDSDGISNTLTSGVWTTQGPETVTRPGGGSWALVDFDTLEVGIVKDQDGANLAQVSTLYITVTYSPRAGGFAIEGG